ncbi:PTS IIA-like nitrogen regulatory protein PtsN [Polynucleobacter sp. HIN6]|uniref:PTS sugar transporter subunit IIA n=1 Tax=Polynucleobacter sp. HIN6 TaxID=3047865 RepID=UPI0025730A23|nr:PTS sugar transporter subunit IIA [Polynucleobacter sp. HIN6]BEI36110.1 PTS IIA-like nitrogen regulatory protein PtsN [Polynucleobacter sp. HIN6]
MNVLSRLFTTDSINLNAQASNKAQAFENAGQYFATKLQIPCETVLSFLNAREALGSTGLGFGVAIPHGRIKGLQEPCAALFKLQTPIEFGAPDGKPVSLLLFLLVPEKATQEHLEILAVIAQLLTNPQTLDQLQNETDPEKVRDLICHWEALQ